MFCLIKKCEVCSMSLRVRTTLFAVASILVSLPVYIILHEGGHALVAVLCGARITKFSVLGAYTTYEGGTFTAVTLSLRKTPIGMSPRVFPERTDGKRLTLNLSGSISQPGVLH